ncbi:hypothetical protein HYW76_03275 [Candidatus Pacearchaeota archaeon]|nr:hypothetical protein [Candidatus Pacearchaeota archaeon]
MKKRRARLAVFLSLLVLVVLTLSFANENTGRAVQIKLCTDKDGGMDYYTASSAVSSNPGKNNPNYADNCTLDKKSVKEAYCSENTPGIRTPFLCPNGCENGACIKGSEPYCTKIGTENEGWYNKEGEVLKKIKCNSQMALCLRSYDSASKTNVVGWFASGVLIKKENCL